MKKRLLCCFLIVVACSFNLPVYADQNVYASNGIAINGMDAVAYFKKDNAIHGSKDFSYKWEDVVWYFESEEHMNLFIGDPERYAPAYGGWCALAVTSMSMLYPSSPETDWMMKQDRLFFLAAGKASSWEGTADQIARGDENFKTIGQSN